MKILREQLEKYKTSHYTHKAGCVSSEHRCESYFFPDSFEIEKEEEQGWVHDVKCPNNGTLQTDCDCKDPKPALIEEINPAFAIMGEQPPINKMIRAINWLLK